MVVLQFSHFVLLVIGLFNLSAAFSLRWSSKGSTTSFVKNYADSRQLFVALQSSMNDIDDMTVIQLKTALKQRGLPVSGVKEELKKRLLSVEKPASVESSGNTDKSVVSRQERQEERKKIYNKPKDSDYENSNSDHEDITTSSSSASVKRGDAIRVEILRYGPLGASVKVLPDLDNTRPGTGAGNALLNNDWVDKTGLILQDHIQYWSALQGRDPEIGEVCDAFIEKVRDDGKLDIAFRPRGYSKVLLATSQILKSLEASASGRIAVGSRSTPEQIWSMWPGMSKGEYKTGIGALLRDGTVVTTDYELILVPVDERVPLPAQVCQLPLLLFIIFDHASPTSTTISSITAH